MPCIIKSKKNGANFYYSFCGKSILGLKKEYTSREDALRSNAVGKSICRACRKEADIPFPERNNDKFVPFIAYEVVFGEIRQIKIVSLSNRNPNNPKFRTDDGRIVVLEQKVTINNVIMRPTGASWSIITKSKEKAISFATEGLDKMQTYYNKAINEIEIKQNNLACFHQKDSELSRS